MTLHNATLDQLIAWQGDIIAELARRAGQETMPVPARSPWEMQAPRAPQMFVTPTQTTNAAQQEVDALRARLAAIEGGHVQTLAPPLGAPPMLGGQRQVLTVSTQRTDPKAAEVFAGMRPRVHDNAPPVMGNGRGMGGQIGFGGE